MAGTPTGNRAPFTAAEVARATGGELRVAGDLPASGVTTDSRGEVLGKVFVALRGERFDGHRFARQALDAGAHVVVIDERGAEEFPLGTVPQGVSVLVVSETTRALGDLALFHRRRWGGQVIGIAGSAGKTTTRSVVGAVLTELRPGRVHSTEANFNNRIGVALTLLGLQAGQDYCVLELGTNSPGEVEELCRISLPLVGVLTLIDLEHTEGLGDLDGVEQEEGALFRALPADGVAIGWGDDPRVLRQMSSSPACAKICYGEARAHATRISRATLGADLRTQVTLELAQRRLEFSCALPGLPGALAAAAAASVAEVLLPGELSAEGLERALGRAGESGRANVVELSEGRLMVDDTYNANPASMRQAIRLGEELAARTGGRLTLVLGDMLELGAQSTAAHRQVGDWVRASRANALFTVGAEATEIRRAAGEKAAQGRHFTAAEEVGPVLAAALEPRDVVVVKASRGVRAERIVRYLLDSNLARVPGKGAAHR